MCQINREVELEFHVQRAVFSALPSGFAETLTGFVSPQGVEYFCSIRSQFLLSGHFYKAVIHDANALCFLSVE